MKKRPALITGGCGFVGRHLVKGLLERGTTEIWIVDDLSTGRDPSEWLSRTWKKRSANGLTRYRSGNKTIVLVAGDAIRFFRDQTTGKSPVKLPPFGDVFHLASIVGGRSLIEGDPLMVATDLAIDAVFFLWLTRDPKNAVRVLYASSSAAYPTHLQGARGAIALSEKEINFEAKTIGIPDLTYGWSKLTGEYLSRLAHKKYGIRIACVRPFSGYGEDQDLTYPTPSIALRVARGDDPIEVWGTGQQGRDFIHIDDCIDSFFAILDHVRDGSAVNIGTGTSTSFIELIKEMLAIEGRLAKIKPLSDKPVGVANRYAHTKVMRAVPWKPRISRTDGLGRVLKGAHERLAGRELPFEIA